MGPKILTVDDSQTIRMIVARAFKPFACEILEAANGVEGLAVANRELPDIILLDLTMPLMDGVEMLGRLKTDPKLKPIPVIMLTAESGRENVLKIARLGVRDYVVKPFKPEMIVERVGRIINLRTHQSTATKGKRLDDPLHILVVDDKPAIHDQIKQGLTGTSWTVESIEQPSQVLNVCTTNPPDLILISLSLPENAGFVLFQMLRANAIAGAIPIFALSVRTASVEQAKAQQMGFKSIVTKPIDPENLKMKITYALSLDTSYKYFREESGALVFQLPAHFDAAVANDATQYLRAKLLGAVDSGLNKLILDLSQLQSADMTLVKLGLNCIQLCHELGMRYVLIGSEAVCAECQKYEESQDWTFVTGFPEALAAFKEKAPLVPRSVKAMAGALALALVCVPRLWSGDYLQVTGPVPLRFLVPAPPPPLTLFQPLQLADVNPTKDSASGTNGEVTANSLTAGTNAVPSQLLEGGPNAATVNAAPSVTTVTSVAATTGQPLISVPEPALPPIVTPQMLVKFFQASGSNGPAASLVIPAFVPPTPPTQPGISTATYTTP